LGQQRLITFFLGKNILLRNQPDLERPGIGFWLRFWSWLFLLTATDQQQAEQTNNYQLSKNSSGLLAHRRDHELIPVQHQSQ
jgi:hypothetical protein